MSIEEDINNSEYTNLTTKDFKDCITDVMNSSIKGMEFVMYTGLYGMYDFEFHVGGVGSPNNYIYHGTRKYMKREERCTYITLGDTFSNIKCKVRMWREVSKIEVMNGTDTLFFSNHFDDVYKELKSRNVYIPIYNRFTRQFKNELND